jgi:superfamily II helicase
MQNIINNIMKISQLCMNRGGAAKQIPYFCHLCQKHSDDIAHRNQTVCGKCAEFVKRDLIIIHYPMMDADVIHKLLEKKTMLDKMDEAQRLNFVCEQLYVGDWDAHYAACDLHLVPRPASWMFRMKS